MQYNDAKNEILQVFSKTERQHLPKLLEWLKTSGKIRNFCYCLVRYRLTLEHVHDISMFLLDLMQKITLGK